jgi:hypothetical protein
MQVYNGATCCKSCGGSAVASVCLLIAILQIGCSQKSGMSILAADERRDLLGVAKGIEETGDLYPVMGPYVEKHELTCLCRALLRDDSADLRQIGLKMVGYHRLGMLAPEVLSLANSGQCEMVVRESALRCLPHAGIPLEVSIASTSQEVAKVEMVRVYGIYRAFLGVPWGDKVLLSMSRIMTSADYSNKVRVACWRELVGAKFRVGDMDVLSEAETWGIADELNASALDRLIALEVSRPLDMRKKVRTYLQVKEPAVRVYAAHVLVGHFNEPDAVPVLVDGISCLEGAVDPWPSVAYLAFNDILGIDGGAFVDGAWDQLTLGEKKELEGLLDRPLTKRDWGEHVLNVLGRKPLTEKRKEKASVANLVEVSLKRALAKVKWNSDTPLLHLSEL